MTLSLATDIGASFSRYLPAGSARNAAQVLEQGYYPVLILAFLAGLIWLEIKSPDQAFASEQSSPPNPQTAGDPA